ncbi:MAG: hypothetical protein GY818_11180 [Planctomycetaceae bacterium]|nr:hypothetical protein [Planctomycetaceae bacterium]
MSILEVVEANLLSDGISPTYKYNCNRHWLRFVRFCALYEFRAVPTTELLLCRYAAYRFSTSEIIGKSFNIELYGIRNATLEMGCAIDIKVKVMPRLGRIRRAWQKKRVSGAVVRKPITSDVLRKFLMCLDKKDYNNQTLRALLCFAKFGLLRVSEYTYGKYGNCPKVENISIIPSVDEARYLVYRFSKSKTNQFGRKERIICICTCPNPCAVHEVIDMLAFRKEVCGSDPLFWLEDGSCPTDDKIRHAIKCLCELCGLEKSAFAPHQLRSGGVVDYLGEGVPDSIIQECARWANLGSMVPYKKLSDLTLVKILEKHV